jgi:hypothetical protein
MTQSPLLGFNNNVKHRGRLFHIQTEDSGVRHPHVITHLFMDGGRILKTIKTSYAEHVGGDKLGQVVRDLMKEQHKMMFIALRDGQFDHVLDSGPPPSMSGPPVHPIASLSPVSARTLPGATTLPPNAVLSTSVPAPTASAPVARPSSTSVAAVKTVTAAAAVKTATAVPALGSPPARLPSPPSSAGMRAAASNEGSGPSTGVRPVPRREAPELFGAPTPEAAVVNVVPEQAAAAAAAAPGSSSKIAAGKEQPGSGRYAASRPAAIFANARNADAGGSIFGDDLISEKSLDEVILSYLSDDLDSSGSKK